MHYIKLNFLELVKKEKFLFILMTITQIFSVVLIFTSYGMINHFDVKVKETEGTSLTIDFENVSEELPDIESVKKFYNAILPTIDKKLDYFWITFFEDGIPFQCYTDYDDRNFVIPKNDEKKLEDQMIKGRYLNEDEITEGKNVAVVGSGIELTDNKLFLKNVPYECVGVFEYEVTNINYAIIPYKSLPDKDLDIYHTTINLEKPLLKSEYDMISEAAQMYLEGKFLMPEFDGINNESDNKVYRDVMFIAVLFVMISVINYCIMYQHILKKRKNRLAVYRICGCGKLKSFMIYLVEILGESLAFLLIGEIVFSKLVLPRLSNIFEYINDFFSKEIYFNISIIYIGVMVVSYVALIGRFVKDTPVSLLKEVD